MTSPLYAIGDVHGCSRMLRRLLALIAEDAGELGIARPRVILLGDLIDRGPDSRGVLDLLTSEAFHARFEATVLRGNHEQMMLDAPNSHETLETWLWNGGAETVESYGIRFSGGLTGVMTRFMAAVPDRHIEFLANLPFAHVEAGHMFVHAGIDPSHPLDRQKPATLMWTRRPFDEVGFDPGICIVHGHTRTATGSVEVRPRRISVDTGCGYAGGTLSAAVIEANGNVEVLSVGPARNRRIDLGDDDEESGET